MRYVIFGGTFNPVHIGHLHTADELLTQLNYDRVIFVPSYIPVHKNPEAILDAVIRVEMLALALKNTSFQLDTCEIDRKGPSYMIDTIEHILQKYNITGKPGLLIGDDLLPGFSSWKNSKMLLEKVDLIVARRYAEKPGILPFPYQLLDNPMLPISSSDIRKRISEFSSYRYLLPRRVYKYIEQHKTYHPHNMDSLLSELKKYISKARLNHSLETQKMAERLARRFSVDIAKCSIAGLLHDIARDKKKNELLELAAEMDIPVRDIDRRKPGLLHAAVGAALVKRELGIHDIEILEAIDAHISGKQGMGSVSSIVYLADAIEADRKHVSDVYREAVFSCDSLDAAVFKVVGDHIQYLKSVNSLIDTSVYLLYDDLKKKVLI